MTVDGFSSSVDGELARHFVGFNDIFEGSESSSDDFVSICKGNLKTMLPLYLELFQCWKIMVESTEQKSSMLSLLRGLCDLAYGKLQKMSNQTEINY